MKTLNDRETATALAALRAYSVFIQTGQWPTGERLQAIQRIARDTAYDEGLSEPEIDQLCQRLNEPELSRRDQVEAVVVRDSREETTIACVTCRRTGQIARPEDILPRLKRALTCWAKETPEALLAWVDSSRDFNVGDLEEFVGEESLVPYLAREGLFDLAVTIVSAGPPQPGWTYDTILMDAAQLSAKT